MRDFNFFSDYVYVKSSFKLRKLILSLIYIIIIGGMVAGYYYMDLKVTDLSDEVATKDKIIQSDEYTETMETVETLKSDIDIFEVVQLEAETFKMIMATKFPVTDELVDVILESIPRNVKFNTYVISANGVQILGTSTDITYIAELEYNFNTLDLFENVFVNVISNNDEEGYSFSLSLEFGGGF